MRPYLACLLAPILLLSTSGSYKSADPREAVRAVLDSIAADLVANNRASLVARYDKRGAILLGNWGLKAYPFDSLPTQVYGAGWSPPVRFAWRNVTIEALSARSAVVYAQFIWHSAERDSSVNSYTGVFLHDGKRWRVRSEHESPDADFAKRFLCPKDTVKRLPLLAPLATAFRGSGCLCAGPQIPQGGPLARASRRPAA